MNYFLGLERILTMGKRNIDKLRSEDDMEVVEFMIELFNQLHKPIPQNLCVKCRRNCNPVNCPYTETHFMLAYLRSERVSIHE